MSLAFFYFCIYILKYSKYISTLKFNILIFQKRVALCVRRVIIRLDHPPRQPSDATRNSRLIYRPSQLRTFATASLLRSGALQQGPCCKGPPRQHRCPPWPERLGHGVPPPAVVAAPPPTQHPKQLPLLQHDGDELSDWACTSWWFMQPELCFWNMCCVAMLGLIHSNTGRTYDAFYNWVYASETRALLQKKKSSSPNHFFSKTKPLQQKLSETRTCRPWRHACYWIQVQQRISLSRFQQRITSPW